VWKEGPTDTQREKETEREKGTEIGTKNDTPMETKMETEAGIETAIRNKVGDSSPRPGTEQLPTALPRSLQAPSHHHC
jgi:hypothetical protein